MSIELVMPWPLNHHNMTNCSHVVPSPKHWSSPNEGKVECTVSILQTTLHEHLYYSRLVFFFFLTFTCQLCYLAIRDADFCAFHVFIVTGITGYLCLFTPLSSTFFLLLFLGRYIFLLRPQARHTILIWLQHRIFLKYWELMTSYHIVQ